MKVFFKEPVPFYFTLFEFYYGENIGSFGLEPGLILLWTQSDRYRPLLKRWKDFNGTVIYWIGSGIFDLEKAPVVYTCSRVLGNGTI